MNYAALRRRFPEFTDNPLKASRSLRLHSPFVKGELVEDEHALQENKVARGGKGQKFVDGFVREIVEFVDEFTTW